MSATFSAVAIVLTLLLALPAPAPAQSRSETLLVLVESGPNSMDIHGVGANFRTYGASWNLYDRLLTHGTKTLADGTRSYDHAVLKPELAESWQVAADGMSVTFKLRRDARFHDGTAVTARDVKWSFDRAVSVGGFPTFQMKAGALEKPEQFAAVDDHTFRVNFLRKDKWTLPDLAVPVPVIINSTLVRKNATEKDPWAMEWLKNNEAGGGAYRLESWKPGQETVYTRFDEWKSGPLAKIRRVIVREVPSAGNRRALIERGDADVSVDFPPKDVAEMARSGKLTVASTPVENALIYLGMNAKNPPFANVKVRQAVAHAVPRDKIFEAAMFGRGALLTVPIATNTPGYDPSLNPYRTDPARARALLAEAGYPNGFETTLSFDLGNATIYEPAAVLAQEALAAIGIKATLNKIPPATWRGALAKKDLPLFINQFGGWLNYPEYFFLWTYHGQNSLFNTSSYQNGEMDKLIEAAHQESDPQKYAETVRAFTRIAMADVPKVPLMQPSLDVAMQKGVTGYQYWFHRQLDFRTLTKQ
ncbi:MAG TPA: ABC transporter substrate-binding protein [Candidatus Acidoferrum sp.]|nr:ABC transporter substrate-binding protein [Candidatus Acidoferrum sp.]